NLFGRKRRQSGVVIVGFNDDLVSAHAVHFVEHAFGLAVQISLNTKGRKFIRDDTHRPAGRIALWRAASVLVRTIGLDLRRGFTLVAGAEGAESPLHFD